MGYLFMGYLHIGYLVSARVRTIWQLGYGYYGVYVNINKPLTEGAVSKKSNFLLKIAVQPGYYKRMVEESIGKMSMTQEEIERDLHRFNALFYVFLLC